MKYFIQQPTKDPKIDGGPKIKFQQQQIKRFRPPFKWQTGDRE